MSKFGAEPGPPKLLISQYLILDQNLDSEDKVNVRIGLLAIHGSRPNLDPGKNDQEKTALRCKYKAGV